MSTGSVAVWGLDTQLRVVVCTERAASLLAGHPAEHVHGKLLSELAPAEVCLRMRRFMRLLAENGGPLVGSSMWRGQRMRSTFHAIRGQTGEMSHMLVLTSPVSVASEDVERTDEADYAHLGEFEVLTRRELEVLSYVGKGLTLAEIAHRMHVSIKTVKRFRDGISSKLGVGDRTSLAIRARDAGLLPHHATLRRLN